MLRRLKLILDVIEAMPNEYPNVWGILMVIALFCMFTAGTAVFVTAALALASGIAMPIR